MASSKTKIVFTSIALISGIWIFNNQSGHLSDEDYQLSSTSESTTLPVEQSLKDNELDISTNATPETHTVTQAEQTAYAAEADTLIGYLSAQEYSAQSQFGELPEHMRHIALLPLSYDKHGNLVLNENIKSLVEHFLMASETEGVESAIARIYEYISLVLPETAALEANEIIERYLGYKERAANEISIDKNEPDMQTLANQITSMVEQKKAIRRELMSPDVVDALFSVDEALDDFNVTTMHLNLDANLSYEEKDQLIASAETKLPPEIRAKKQYSREKKNLNREITRLRTLNQPKGQTEEKVYELRKAFYGKETADRITYYEDDAPEWLSRVENYQTLKTEILSQDLDSSTQQLQINNLKTGMFDEKEQLKLAVFNIRQRAAQ